jgi:hypothetical protein
MMSNENFENGGGYYGDGRILHEPSTSTIQNFHSMNSERALSDPNSHKLRQQ